MELLQDGVTLIFALIAIIASVIITEQMLARSNAAKGVGALWALLISFVCLFAISEVSGFFSAAYLAVPHLTGYGRTFSYAVLGLILYVPIRIYQLMRQRRAGEDRP